MVSGDPGGSVSKITRTEQTPRLPHSGYHRTDRRKLASLQGARVGTWNWNISSGEVHWDARCKVLFGQPESAPDLLSLDDFLSHIHPEDLEYTRRALKDVLEHRVDYDVIHRILCGDGTVRWVRCLGGFSSLEPHSEVSGITIDMSWFKRASEERTRVEQLLRFSNTELQGQIRQRTSELMESAAKIVLQSKLLDLAQDAIFVCGLDQRVSFWNHGAERLYGWTSEEARGKSVHDLLQTQFPVPVSEILSRDHWEGELRHTRRDGTQLFIASRWTTLRDEQHKLVAWLQINTDISARKLAQQAASALSSRILTLQDEERRRIARELHDSLGQCLTSVMINLELMRQETTERSSERSARLSECLGLAEQCLTETRTLSHLLHPPLLDEAGFASAARWYVEGFAKRSGLDVIAQIPSDLPRLRSNMELCLFRILQESLTNVHRHSGCSCVRIKVEFDADRVMLTVTDNGKGIPAERLRELRETSIGLGVGLAGMRERAMELGGQLIFDSDGSGTMVSAIMPLAKSSQRGASPLVAALG